MHVSRFLILTYARKKGTMGSNVLLSQQSQLTPRERGGRPVAACIFDYIVRDLQRKVVKG